MSARPTALLCDDSRALRMLAARQLDDCGFDVVGEADNGEDAVAQFLKLQPDVVLLDLVMPKRDALGELVNVLMGYVVRETVPADASYRAAPPDFAVSAVNFLRQDDRTLAVAMTSPLGPFVLIVNN